MVILSTVEGGDERVDMDKSPFVLPNIMKYVFLSNFTLNVSFDCAQDDRREAQDDSGTALRLTGVRTE